MPTSKVVHYARRTLGDLRALRERLDADTRATLPPRVVEEAARMAVSSRGTVFESVAPLEAFVDPAPEDDEAADMLDAGKRAVEKVAREGDSALLTPREQVGLEAVILLFGRPALFVQRGSFAQPPPEWDVLNEHRHAIEATLRSVGRIELEGAGMVGTGFLVAPDVIMTNRHVASVFSRKSLQGGWRFKAGLLPFIDYFAEDMSGSLAAQYSLTGVIGIHDAVDLALLGVSRESTGTLPDEWSLGEPLRIAAAGPQGEGRDVYLVGYPAIDKQGVTPPDALLRIFSNVFEVKRLQPGKLTELADDHPVFTHDCSTLGGNSGSCVVDLETHRVIGLHFKGEYLEDNFAVALWKLTRDPIVSGVDIDFA